MKNTVEEIKEFIWNYIDDDGQIIEIDEFEGIQGLISYVNKNFNCKIELKHVGGFNSPGYDVDCYAWAGIIDDKLYFDTLEQERC